MFKYVKFGVKTGIAGAAIYYTAKEGLWDDAEKSDQLYRKLYTAAVPYVKEVSVVEVPDLPKLDDICYGVQHYWNCGVKVSFAFVRDLPEHVASWTKTGASKISEQFQQLTSDSAVVKKE